MRRTWFVIFVGVLSAGCGDDDGTTAYEARVEAAQARVADATCACAPAPVREQCARYAGVGLDADCSAEVAAALAEEHPVYAECLAHGYELYARCLEEASCGGGKRASCAHDPYTDCGPVPADLNPAATTCLPRFQCDTGQHVSLNRRCNGQRDCFDGSDEAGCPE